MPKNINNKKLSANKSSRWCFSEIVLTNLAKQRTARSEKLKDSLLCRNSFATLQEAANLSETKFKNTRAKAKRSK